MKAKGHCLLFLCMLLTAYATSGQQYVRKNEKIVFSFETENHKRCVVARDSSDKYIVYRFGTPSKIELEYPPLTPESWKTMKYYHYMSPDLELNYLNFVRGDLRYVVYDTYSNDGGDGESEIGVKVLDLKGNLILRQAGKAKTKVGMLSDLQYAEQIGKGDEYSNE